MDTSTTDPSPLEPVERKPGLGARLAKRAQDAGAVAWRIGGRVGGIAADGTRLARHQTRDLRLRRRLDERYRALGRAVYQAHKHARGESPFVSVPDVETELAALEEALGEYRTNREERARAREQLRRMGR